MKPETLVLGDANGGLIYHPIHTALYFVAYRKHSLLLSSLISFFVSTVHLRMLVRHCYDLY